jgi:hypothetical protein
MVPGKSILAGFLPRDLADVLNVQAAVRPEVAGACGNSWILSELVPACGTAD